MKEERLQPVRGMRDLIYEDAEKLIHIIKVAREVSYRYGYSEAILPTIEYYSLFAEKSGYEISKRMYVFEDLSGRKLALRPELTPSVARVFINHLQARPKPIRISYFANVFRYDEPQRARYREFWQAGFEHIGSPSLLADLEVIMLSYDIFSSLGLEDVKIKLGSMDLIKKLLMQAGVEYKDLPYFLFLADKKNFDELSKELSKYEKGKECYELLLSLSQIKGSANRIIEEAKALLKDAELISSLEKIAFITKCLIEDRRDLELDLSFARGIEYYTGIIYEFQHKDLGVSIGGGGRYDLLIEYYGGPKTPATGCALGLDRIALIYKGEFKQKLRSALIFLLEQDEKTIKLSFQIASELRRANMLVCIDTSNRGISESLSYASKLGYDYFIIIGPKELKEGKVVVRSLKEKTQEEVYLNSLLDFFSKNK